VARQKRDLPGDDSQAGTPPAALFGRCLFGVPYGNLGRCSAGIEIDLTAGGIVEDEIVALG